MQAKRLFLKGSEMERSGKLYEAIQFYRRAMQLVPDIEFRLDSVNKNNIKDQKSQKVDINIGKLILTAKLILLLNFLLLIKCHVKL